MKVILASASPRRKELLKNIYSNFSVIAPKCEERANGTPSKYVMQIAKQKALAVEVDADLIISADTIVVYKGKILGKPKNIDDAIQTLFALSGKKHYVYSGVCLKYKNNHSFNYEVFYDKSIVHMKKLSQNQIYEYIKTGSPLDKAGSYGIQDGVVKNYEGSYTNIVGLPIEKLKTKLIELGLI